MFLGLMGLLLKQKLVLLNSIEINSNDIVVSINDFISLIIFNNIYFFFKVFKKNFFKLFRKKFMLFIYQFRRYRVNIFKDRKRIFSKKYIKYSFSKKDFKNFFEFDYYNLSGFIIYNSLLPFNKKNKK
jgi:hypothetical protein